jgi:hypothetical protein
MNALTCNSTVPFNRREIIRKYFVLLTLGLSNGKRSLEICWQLVAGSRQLADSSVLPASEMSVLWIRIRVRPFRLNFFFAYKRNKANLDPFHMCFTISL